MQSALLGLSKTRQRSDGLRRSKCAHYAAHCPQNALRGAIIAVIRVMRIADKATIARRVGLPSGKGANLAMKLANSGADQRHFGGKAKVVDDQARGEIIAAVDDDINAR